MKVEMMTNFDEKYLDNTVKEVDNLIKIPESLEIYFVDEEKDLKKIQKSFPEKAHHSFKELYGGISFSYSFNNRNIVVIYITDDKKYLLKNKDALIGLLLHEVMHTIQRIKGLDLEINLAYNENFYSKFGLLKNIDSDEEKIIDIFNNIGLYSVLFLKELYANNELMERDLWKYLLEFYKEEFSHQKSCPEPVFYDKLKDAVREDVLIVKSLFQFEFALLSSILPFKKFKIKEADELIEHINSCYRINIREISKKCDDISLPYLEDFEDEGFKKEFFSSIFKKVYDLLR